MDADGELDADDCDLGDDGEYYAREGWYEVFNGEPACYMVDGEVTHFAKRCVWRSPTTRVVLGAN